MARARMLLASEAPCEARTEPAGASARDGSAGVAPRLMGMGPVPATQRAAGKSGAENSIKWT